VIALRKALRDPSNADVNARARALDDRIMRPLRPFLSVATRLLISPDGGLNLVPFETLVDEHGRYLIERYATTYLTSGRDLLRMHTARAAAGTPVIVADPLFGEPSASASRRGPPDNGDNARSVTVGADLSGLYFAPLLGSALEGQAIKSLFPNATLLTGRRATKTTLTHITAPSILHIASHGFFLEDDATAGSESVIAQNPLLRSGLALAGANLSGTSQGNGILTALEAAGLNLWGTSLVTLSACDTGVGDIRNGEGVYGLRRAFMLAGAETLVMSLWPVSDAIARDTMVAYYARLRSGAAAATRSARQKLSILRRPALRHPYYWGGFIQSGDWTTAPYRSLKDFSGRVLLHRRVRWFASRSIAFPVHHLRASCPAGIGFPSGASCDHPTSPWSRSQRLRSSEPASFNVACVPSRIRSSPIRSPALSTAGRCRRRWPRRLSGVADLVNARHC
jgi:CHAT domain-containing protein